MKSSYRKSRNVCLHVVELCSGGGGLSTGFEKAGFSIKLAVDVWQDALETYKKNHPDTTVVQKNIRFLEADDVIELSGIDSCDVLLAGLPCQGFSMANRIWRSKADDPRNYLFRNFIRILRGLKPSFFVIENVAALPKHNSGRTLKTILSSTGKLGYKTDYRILNAADYGVPQFRRRIFIMGNNVGADNIFPEKTHCGCGDCDLPRYRTVKDAIGDLPPLESGQSSRKYNNHEAMNHTESMLKKMKFVKDGGDRTQIPELLRPSTGDQRKYIRYNSKEPSICVTGDMRKVFHYSQNRALTVRELARLQSFEDDYKFLGSRVSQQQQVGDAVPPLLAKAVANGVMTGFQS